MDRTAESAEALQHCPSQCPAMPRQDLFTHQDAAAAADYPDTVEFGLDGDDLPTHSLEAAELELVVPTFSDGVPRTEDFPESPSRSDREHQPAGIAPAVEIMPSEKSVREIGPGAVLRNRYLIEKSLGIGGGSTVFSAVDRHRIESPGACGKVAVKVLHPRFRLDNARVFRLIREFRHMQRLTHTGIARVFDLDCDAGVWFITMELLEGQSLHRQLQDGLQEEDALRILTQCTEALAYAHEQGVMHGDLKPGNIFITHDGSVRLLDFGSVPDRDEAVAADRSPSHLAATLAYASPQLIEEKGVEPRDDLFSLGCVAYELFSGGQHPFDRQSSLEARRRNLRPADIRALPARRFAVIAQMLAWERTARPASAHDFLHSFLALDFRPAGHSGNAEVVHRADVAGPSADSPDSMRNDSGPTDTVVDAAGKQAANEHTFSGALSNDRSDDWIEPGSRSPTTPEPPARAADLSKLNVPADISKAGLPGETNRESVRRKPQVQENFSDGHALAARRESIHGADLQFWLRKALLIALFFLLIVGGIVLSRQWRADAPMPVATAPATTPVGSAAKITTPKTTTTSTDQAIVAPMQPVARSVVPAVKPTRPAPLAAPPVADPASFQSALVKVGSSQQWAVVNIIREKSTAGTARVAWSIIANTAKPGVDYESPDSQIARFNDGQRVRSLYIPLKHPARDRDSSPRRERRFTVQLQSAPGALMPGRINRAEVIISAP